MSKRRKDAEAGMFEKLKAQLTTNNLNPQHNAELRELLRQIDSMVCRKRDDWQGQFDKLSDTLKERDSELKLSQEQLATQGSQLSSTNLRMAQFESNQKELLRQYETQMQSLKDKLRTAGHSPDAKRATATINRLNKELLKEKEELHSVRRKHDDLETKHKMSSHKVTSLARQNEELNSRLKNSEKQLASYQQQLRRANRMLADLERSSQALVSRLESELMRDKRLLEQQESLARSLQSKLDQSDQRVFALQKELKVLGQRNMELMSIPASGMATPSLNQTLTNAHGSPDKLLSPTGQSNQRSKIEIERSKLIRYAKELRRRVQDRDAKINQMEERASEAATRENKSAEESQSLLQQVEETTERYETEIKSLTSSISRANSETMHYKRDLEAIKMEISTVTKLLISEEQPGMVRSAGGVECLDHMIEKLMERFEVKKVPVETSESGVNTSFEETVVPVIETAEDVQEQGDVEEEEVITPRMMQDITNSVPQRSPAKQESPKRRVPKPGFISGRPQGKILNAPQSNFDNPSLTQDINAIMAREELDRLQRSTNTTARNSPYQQVVQDEVVIVENAENITPAAGGEHNRSMDANRTFDPNGTLSILEDLDAQEDLEMKNLDKLLQSHIDNFLAETAEFA